MEEVQRARVLEAMAEAMAERGAGGADVTVADVIMRAGVSAAAFHEAFADREACMLAAFELGVSRARASMIAAYDSELRWLDAIKDGLAAFLRFQVAPDHLRTMMTTDAALRHPGHAALLDEVETALDRLAHLRRRHGILDRRRSVRGGAQA